MSTENTQKTGHFASCAERCADCADDASLSDGERETLVLRERIRVLEEALETALDKWAGWVESEVAGCSWFDAEMAKVDDVRRVLEGKP